jgi:hypothetical protein
MHTQGNTFELSMIEPSYFWGATNKDLGFFSHHNKEIFDMVFPLCHHLIFIPICYLFCILFMSF